MRSDYQESKKKRVGLRYAVNGLKYAYINEINIRIHFIIASLVIIFGFIFSVSIMEWVMLLIMIGFVVTAELLNTAVEAMLDYLAPDWHPMAGAIKDLTASAVLVASIIAATVGLIIFLPKVLILIFN
ncbi:diacylglycerol kinase family protein [Amphibacillus sp. MSJ-3]|uniref:diacylglycerol kinase family protein n=1 Tax=Amphibacillus sp. MSJ-3 TaxID=2841505 RepID=UPI001C0F0DA5|nr:diacylglycerol kinase family protein [Amphibacillus sp. MSJ-3]MBU5595165.1 diacylglycerol kinase family protein [Amphibacillus sp. MSJ-3]